MKKDGVGDGGLGGKTAWFGVCMCVCVCGNGAERRVSGFVFVFRWPGVSVDTPRLLGSMRREEVGKRLFHKRAPDTHDD